MQLRNVSRWLTTVASAPVTENGLKSTRFLSKQLLAPRNQRPSTISNRLFFMASSKACQSAEASQARTNQLIHSKSPYLLQHAHNPVDWYTWGEEAFKKAREEQKLIFLSVGYSTCHWCHVMEKESFENPAVAELMNKFYVNIKVDREERPDVDKMYMNFIQAVSGSGGWPMSVWLTPDLRPVFGGTYYPPDDRYYGRPGFGTILKSLAAQWKENPGKFGQSGEQIVSILANSVALKGLGDTPSAAECSTRCFQQLQNSYEPTYGGFNKSPKFPQPVNLQFLLRHHLKTRSDLKTTSQSLEMCLHTLRQMAKGGIHDHVSKGFARYSTDEKWHVPHFEKMLYDQAQLAAVYAEAYLVTKDESLARVVREIFDYVEECLSDPSGGFYSAEDADSYPSSDVKEKKEGAFYVWTFDEVQSLLGKITAGDGQNFSLADVVCHHFDIRPSGNVEPYQDPHDELKRQNVLIIRASREETADKFGLVGGVDALDRLLSRALAIMKQVRDKRPRPHLDDKMLASWNGLMISALAKAGAILNDKTYIDRAINAARFMRAHLYDQDSGRLLRSCYRSASDDGPSQNPVPIEGFLDDYAFTIGGLLDLFNVCQDEQWLQWADQLQRKQDQLFWDAEPTSGAYFTSAQGDANLLVRSKEDQDGAEPSGNSVSVSNLVRLSLLLDCGEYRDKAGRILQLFHQRLSRVPVALPAMVSALIMYEDSPTEVVVVGPSSSEAVSQLTTEAQGHVTSLLGQLVVRFDPSDPVQRNGFIAGRRPELLQMKSSPPAAYLCRHRSCSAPVESAADLRRLLDR